MTIIMKNRKGAPRCDTTATAGMEHQGATRTGRNARMSASGNPQKSEDEQQAAIMKGARMSACCHPRCGRARSSKETEDDHHDEGQEGELQGATQQRQLEWNTKERPIREGMQG